MKKFLAKMLAGMSIYLAGKCIIVPNGEWDTFFVGAITGMLMLSTTAIISGLDK